LLERCSQAASLLIRLSLLLICLPVSSLSVFSPTSVRHLSPFHYRHCQSSHQPQFVTYLPLSSLSVFSPASVRHLSPFHYRHCQSSHQPQFVTYLPLSSLSVFSPASVRHLSPIIVTVSLLTCLISSLISLPVPSLSVLSPTSFRHLSLFQCHHCQSCHQPQFVTYLSSSAITVSLVTSLSSSLISLPVPSLSVLSPASVHHFLSDAAKLIVLFKTLVYSARGFML